MNPHNLRLRANKWVVGVALTLVIPTVLADYDRCMRSCNIEYSRMIESCTANYNTSSTDLNDDRSSALEDYQAEMYERGQHHYEESQHSSEPAGSWGDVFASAINGNSEVESAKQQGKNIKRRYNKAQKRLDQDIASCKTQAENERGRCGYGCQ